MQSLRDKLLQAGVVTAEQAQKNQAQQDAAKRERSERRTQPQVRQPVAPAPETDKERDRRLNREVAERQKKIRGLCDAHEISERGEQTFFYRTRKRELRRLHLLPEQIARLEKGELAIVDRPNGNERPHSLVPRAVAEQILKIEERGIRFWAKGPGENYGFDDAPASDAEQAAATEGSAADVDAPTSEEDSKTA